MSFGYLMGPAVGTLLGGLLMSAFGWRSIFLLLGAALGLFSANYSFYLILAWLPFYLVKARGFSVESIASTASWAYLLTAIFALLAGWFWDHWIKARRSGNLAYKGVMAVNHLLGTRAWRRCWIAGERNVARSLYEAMAGVASPGLFAIPQIFAGPHATGRWVGVHNCVGAMAGIIAPAVTGLLVEATGHFVWRHPRGGRECARPFGMDGHSSSNRANRLGGGGVGKEALYRRFANMTVRGKHRSSVYRFRPASDGFYDVHRRSEPAPVQYPAPTYSQVAQLVEQRTENPRVGGLNSLRATIRSTGWSGSRRHSTTYRCSFRPSHAGSLELVGNLSAVVRRGK